MSNITNLNNTTREDIRIPADAYAIGEFNGKQRYIRFDLNAFAEMERMYGDMEKANEALSKGSINDIRKILWLGLIWNEAILDEVTGEPFKYSLTIYEVGSWLTPTNMKKVIGDLTRAINGALPQDTENNEPQKTAAAVITTHAAVAAGEEVDPNSENPAPNGTGPSTTTLGQ